MADHSVNGFPSGPSLSTTSLAYTTLENNGHPVVSGTYDLSSLGVQQLQAGATGMSSGQPISSHAESSAAQSTLATGHVEHGQADAPMQQVASQMQSGASGGVVLTGPTSNMTSSQRDLQYFWPNTMRQVEHLKPQDFKVMELPLARIKKIMKQDDEVKQQMISAEVPMLFSKAAEIFISELTLRAWIHTEENKRRTLQRNDIALAVGKYDQFDFLIDIVPREELRANRSRGDLTLQQTFFPPEQMQLYFQVMQQQQQQQQQNPQQQQQTSQQQQQSGDGASLDMPQSQSMPNILQSLFSSLQQSQHHHQQQTQQQQVSQPQQEHHTHEKQGHTSHSQQALSRPPQLLSPAESHSVSTQTQAQAHTVVETSDSGFAPPPSAGLQFLQQMGEATQSDTVSPTRQSSLLAINASSASNSSEFPLFQIPAQFSSSSQSTIVLDSDLTHTGVMADA